MHQQPVSDDLIRSFLQGRHVHCPVCHYEVRDLQDRRCPECGKELTLHLSPVERHLRLLITACTGLAMGFGFFAFVLLITIVQTIDKGQWPGPGYTFWVILIPSTLILGAALAVMCLRSSMFARAARRRQIAITIASWILSLILVTTLTVVIIRIT